MLKKSFIIFKKNYQGRRKCLSSPPKKCTYRRAPRAIHMQSAFFCISAFLSFLLHILRCLVAPPPPHNTTPKCGFPSGVESTFPLSLVVQCGLRQMSTSLDFWIIADMDHNGSRDEAVSSLMVQAGGGDG